MKERLYLIMRENNLTASAFADAIGVQRSSISHIVSGRNKPSYDFIERILKRFPEINANWLIRGEGDMYNFFDQEKNNNKKNVNKGINGGVSEKINEKVNEKDKEEPRERVKEGGKEGVKGRISRIIVLFNDNTFEEFVK